jgi:Homeodomain-like domain
MVRYQSMEEIEELSIAQIAERCQVTPRTVQRWIKSVRLPAVPLANNRYAVKPSDLAKVQLHEHATPSDVDRLELRRYLYDDSLQATIQDLKYSIDDLSIRLAVAEDTIDRLSHKVALLQNEQREKAPTRRKKKAKKARSGGYWIPDDYVVAKNFAALHGIPWSAVTRSARQGSLTILYGDWHEGWSRVRAAFDYEQCINFYRIFHTHKNFTPCHSCPHEWQW